MSNKKQMEIVIFQIRIKRCSELDPNLRREVVFLELIGSGKDKKGKKVKKKKLWKTPLVEVSAKRMAGFGKPLYPMFLLQRRIPHPGSNLKPEPLEITFKLKHVQGGKKKPKTVTAWKMNIMRFYKVTENVNTVLFKDEKGARITVNVVDITELQKNTPGLTIANHPTENHGEGTESEENSGKTTKKLKKRRFSKKKKGPKKDEHGLPIEDDDDESASGSVTDSDVSDVESSVSDMSISENQFVDEAASEMESFDSNLNLQNAIDFDELSEMEEAEVTSKGKSPSNGKGSNFFSLESVIHDDRHFDMMYKVIVIGNSGVGKSSVLGRWTRDDYSLNMSSTIHVELSAKSFDCGGKTVKVQFWDTAGQERFNALSRQYYRGAQGAVLVYDITFRPSFVAIPRWLSEVRSANPEVVLLMIGNKSDITQLRQVTTEEALEYSKKEGIAFLETSAMNGTNCTRAMQNILQEIHKLFEKKKPKQNNTSDVDPKVPTSTQTIRLDIKSPTKREGTDTTKNLSSSNPKKEKKSDCTC